MLGSPAHVLPFRTDRFIPPVLIPQSVHGSDFPSPSSEGLQPFIRVTAHWGKGNTQALQGLLDAGSELTLTPGGLKYYYGTGAYGNHIIKGILVPVQLTMDPLEPDPISDHFPHLQMCNWNGHIQQWQNLPIGFLASGLRQVEASETAPPYPSHDSI